MYGEDCCIHLDAKKSLPDKFKAVRKAFSKAVKAIHSNKDFKAKDLQQKEILGLVTETYNALKEAIDTGIKHEIPEALRDSLNNDVFIFSGMKTYTQLKEVSGLLLDDAGNIKPFDKFRADVLQIDATYNQTYLESEYQFATHSAQMAAKWQDVAADAGRYNLQYRTAGDSKVRESHQALHNITLPPDDDFWNSYYPPNGWRCRCTAVQVSKTKYTISSSEEAMKSGEEATTVLDKNGKNSAAIFRFNPGKQKIIFPPTHPYSKIAKNAKETIKSIAPK